MINFEGNTAYLVPPKNRYQLSLYEPHDVTDYNFTFVAKVKGDWDKMNAFDKTREGGVITKNGKHIGLSVLKNTDSRLYVRGQFWCKLPDSTETFYDLFLEVEDDIKDSVLDIAFVHNKSEKKLALLLNDKYKEITYNGDIIDYSDSWVWVGCQNAFDSCDEHHRGFLFGEIHYAAIFGTALLMKDIKKTFVYEKKKNINFNYKPLCIFNFKEKTPYKILDITGNGNNMIMFDKKWMEKV